MKLLRRNLSLMLAVRYLNPLRTMFSIITLICLGGVALGVMVLIVVLSVMEGLQKEIEDKALAFAPHYVVTLRTPVNGYWQSVAISDSLCSWREIQERIQQDPEVESVYPLLEGDAFAESQYNRTTIHFAALQPGNGAQMAPLQEMLREGTFDFGEGLDEECVISQETANQLGLSVGDTIHITPVGNMDEVADIYTLIQKPLLTHETPGFLDEAASLFADVPEDSQAPAIADPEKMVHLMSTMLDFPAKGLRQSELDACRVLYQLLDAHMDGSTFSPEERRLWNATAQGLAALDRDKEDGKAVKSISRMTMPITPRIVGIYQAPENMGGPSVYLPLKLAQDVLGLDTDGADQVLGLCIRVKDIHNEGNNNFVERVFTILPPPSTFDGTYAIENRRSMQDTSVTTPPAAAEEARDDAPPPLEEDVELVIDETPAPEVAEAAGETPVEEPAGALPAPEADNGKVIVGASLPFIWEITPWTESFKRWSELIANERTMMNFVLSVISLIASFCIMAVMFTMSIQRKREIAVLQALGATPGKIMGIFAWQGFIIGLAGSVLGILLALLVLHYRLEIQAVLASIGMDPFPMQAHGITLPANYDPVTFTKQAVIAFVMVMVAAIIPAFIVSRQDPAKALRSN